MPADEADRSTLLTAVASLEQRVTLLTLLVQQQQAQLGHITDLITDLRNRTDFNAAQVGQLLRILASGVREIRETQIYSLLAEGPVSVSELRQLQAVSRDRQESILALDTPKPPSIA
jgi:uncharacterized protein involved in tellurium resistance